MFKLFKTKPRSFDEDPHKNENAGGILHHVSGEIGLSQMG